MPPTKATGRGTGNRLQSAGAGTALEAVHAPIQSGQMSTVSLQPSASPKTPSVMTMSDTGYVWRSMPDRSSVNVGHVSEKHMLQTKEQLSTPIFVVDTPCDVVPDAAPCGRGGMSGPLLSAAQNECESRQP